MDMLTTQILISVCAFLIVVLGGYLIIQRRDKQNKTIEKRMVGVLEDDPFFKKPAKEEGLLKFFEKVGNVASHGKPDAALWEQMIQAGFLHPYAPAIYTGIKILLFIIGIGGSALLIFLIPDEMMQTMTKVTLVLVIATLIFFMPNTYIWYRLKKRHDEIYRHLPEAVDLLEICVSSGLGLDMAWNIVADEIRQVSPVLSGSMSLTNFEMHLGVTRVDAMKHMADRTGVDELKSLAAILIQTDRFGTSISETLQVFAKSIREDRSFLAQEVAEKMSVKLLFPMILFIFPAILIVIVGPAFIKILNAL